MPRPRPRTRLHILAEAIHNLDQATACLHEIDLRNTELQLRPEMKAARDAAAAAVARARSAYLAAAVAGLTPLPSADASTP